MIDSIILSSIGVDSKLIEKYSVIDSTDEEIVVLIKLASSEKDVCRNCGSSLKKIKDYSYKEYFYYGLVSKNIHIIFQQKRFKCECGKTSMQMNPFMQRSNNYKVTLNIKKAIINLLKFPISSKFIALKVGVSDQTVIRILNGINPKPGNTGEILCIDEYSYKRKRGKTKYGCLLINGDTNELIDVLSDRKKETIVSFLFNLTLKKNKLISIFCMDMFDTYRQAVTDYNPKAIIVVDKFHLIKRLNKVIDDVRIRIMRRYSDTDYHYKMLKKFNKKLLKKNIDSYEHQIKFRINKTTYEVYESDIVNELTSYSNDLKTAYERIHFWVKNHDKWDEKSAEKHLKNLTNYCENYTDIKELKDLVPVLKDWKNEIINSFVFYDKRKLSNAIAEESVRKIKDLKRALHGFNNFKNFRARCFLIFSKKDPIKYGKK